MVVLSFLIWFSLKGLHRVGMDDDDDDDGFSRVIGPFMDQLSVTQDARTFVVFKDQPGPMALEFVVSCQ